MIGRGCEGSVEVLLELMWNQEGEERWDRVNDVAAEEDGLRLREVRYEGGACVDVGLLQLLRRRKMRRNGQ